MTCPAAPNTIITGANGNTGFNHVLVPNSKLGLPLNFEVDGAATPVSATTVTVFKLPKVAEVVKVGKARWTERGLEVDLKVDFSVDPTSDLTHKSYMIYEWENKDRKWNTISKNTDGATTFVIKTSASFT